MPSGLSTLVQTTLYISGLLCLSRFARNLSPSLLLLSVASINNISTATVVLSATESKQVNLFRKK